MLDDLIELAVDIGGEIIGAVVKHRSKKSKQKQKQKKTKDSKSKDPWEQPKEKPVWEE